MFQSCHKRSQSVNDETVLRCISLTGCSQQFLHLAAFSRAQSCIVATEEPEWKLVDRSM